MLDAVLCVVLHVSIASCVDFIVTSTKVFSLLSKLDFGGVFGRCTLQHRDSLTRRCLAKCDSD